MSGETRVFHWGKKKKLQAEYNRVYAYLVDGMNIEVPLFVDVRIKKKGRGLEKKMY